MSVYSNDDEVVPEISADEKFTQAMALDPFSSEHTRLLKQAAQKGHLDATYNLAVLDFSNLRFQSAQSGFQKVVAGEHPKMTEAQGFLDTIETSNLVHD